MRLQLTELCFLLLNYFSNLLISKTWLLCPPTTCSHERLLLPPPSMSITRLMPKLWWTNKVMGRCCTITYGSVFILCCTTSNFYAKTARRNYVTYRPSHAVIFLHFGHLTAIDGWAQSSNIASRNDWYFSLNSVCVLC